LAIVKQQNLLTATGKEKKTRFRPESENKPDRHAHKQYRRIENK